MPVGGGVAALKTGHMADTLGSASSCGHRLCCDVQSAPPSPLVGLLRIDVESQYGHARVET